MVRTDELWRYTGTVKLSHYHSGDDYSEEPARWETLTAVTPSEAQGYDLYLEDGCKLQSCFGETENEVQVIWHEDVLNWGYRAE